MEIVQTEQELVKKYQPLAIASGLGSVLGSGIIVGMSATITVWQVGLHLSNSQVGFISGALTFAIAIGSMLAGTITTKIGLVRSFNWMVFLYAIGALICVLAQNYLTLLIGTIWTGFFSGLDLPISLTIISQDVPNDKASSKLIASTQIFWQVGVFASYGAAFLVSKLSGAMGARIVFAILAIFAIIIWVWRTTSHKFRLFHELGEINRKDNELRNENDKAVSLKNVLFGKEKHKYLQMLLSIVIFYFAWNLLANTFGQFQTFMLVQANASQSFATGAGLVLNFVSLFATMGFAKVAGGKYRNVLFVFGMIIQFISMFSLAILSHDLWPIVIAIGVMSIGSNIAGEAIYKVWTQEAFPIEIRSSLQGLIGGVSRFICGLFALITPALVMQSVIKKTMLGFSGLIVVALIAGISMTYFEKKYNIRK